MCECVRCATSGLVGINQISKLSLKERQRLFSVFYIWGVRVGGQNFCFISFFCLFFLRSDFFSTYKVKHSASASHSSNNSFCSVKCPSDFRSAAAAVFGNSCRAWDASIGSSSRTFVFVWIVSSQGTPNVWHELKSKKRGSLREALSRLAAGFSPFISHWSTAKKISLWFFCQLF